LAPPRSRITVLLSLRRIALATNLVHERIQYWVGVGAQMSDRVAKLVAKFPAAAPAEAVAA
jgi:ribosomal protein S16